MFVPSSDSVGTKLILLVIVLGLTCGCQLSWFRKKSTNNNTPPPNLPAPNWPADQPNPYTPTNYRFTPRTQVHWSIHSMQNEPVRVMAGKTVVGPDGSLVLGPYGQFRVEGMSAKQAALTMEAHLSQFVTNPRVTLLPAGNPSPRTVYNPSAPRVKPVVRNRNGYANASIQTVTWSASSSEVSDDNPLAQYAAARYRETNAKYASGVSTQPTPSRHTSYNRRAASQSNRAPILRWLFD